MSIEDVFTNFSSIETERLILRQIQASDADTLFALFSAEEVMEFSGGKLPHRSVEKSRSFIRQLQHWYER